MKTHLNPPNMHRSPAFSQVVVVEEPSKTIYVGGQNGVGADGQVVGETLGEQTAQAVRNVTTALEAAGASWGDVVRLAVYVVAGQDLDEGFSAFIAAGVLPDPPPTLTVLVVAGLNPGCLVEIEAVAAISAET